MKRSFVSQIWGLLAENFSYKIVSLFIALILWVTILGRRDFTYVKTIDLEFKVASGYSIVAKPEEVRLRVSGTRMALKKFIEMTGDDPLTIDLTDRRAGRVEMDVPLSQLDIPSGLRILSVRPALIRAEIFSSSSTITEPQQENNL